jgi:hypothetical protein
LGGQVGRRHREPVHIGSLVLTLNQLAALPEAALSLGAGCWHDTITALHRGRSKLRLSHFHPEQH